jgi:hypothetical protein
VTTAERLQAILDAALVAANADKQTPRARPSNATDCPRALALDFVHGPRDMAQLRYVLAAACGTAVGNVLEAGAAKAGALCQERISLPPMAGSLDSRFPGEGVWDWKVVGEKSWKRVKDGPNEKHVAQLAVYCAATRETRWTLAYVRGVSIFKDELEWRVFTGHADPAQAERIQTKWTRILRHVEERTLPVIPDTYGPESFPCATRGKEGLSVWCGHYQHCWAPSPMGTISLDGDKP